jgi:CRISPR/Cas system CSM-associated protein Csm2 small subunit
MEYITDIFVNDKRVATHARLHTAQEEYQKVFDNSDLFDNVQADIEHNGVITTVQCPEEFEAYVLGAERAHAWKPKSDSDIDFYDEYALKHGTVKGYVASRNFNCEESKKEKTMLEKILESSAEKNKDAINPSHYKDIVPGYQYMEMMVYMLKGLDGVESHLKGQVYKYLMRCGKKDETLQELKKAKWYLDALVKYHEQGKVI